MGFLPLPEWKVTPHGAFGYVRHDASEGSAGAGGYPSTHYGVDLAGDIGDPVRAPEAGELVAVMANLSGKDVQPWRGYGPGLVVLKGDSGRWHLLAHLDAADLKARFPVWSDASKVDPAKDIRAQAGNTDVVIARGGDKSVPRVDAGDVVGLVGTARHVHWEVRKNKLSSGYNPAVWARTFVWHGDPPADAQASLDAAMKPEDSLVIVALAIVVLTFWPGRKRKALT